MRLNGAETVCNPERIIATPAAVAAATAAAAATRTRREKAASHALAASISRLNRPKPRDPGFAHAFQLGAHLPSAHGREADGDAFLGHREDP